MPQIGDSTSAFAGALQQLANNVHNGGGGGNYNSGSMSAGPSAFQTTRRLEPHEDSLRGQAFKGKLLDNFGVVEIVHYMYEDQGKMYVTFESGMSMPLLQMNAMYEPTSDRATFVNKAAAKGLNYDDGTTSDGRPQRRNTNQQAPSNMPKFTAPLEKQEEIDLSEFRLDDEDEEYVDHSPVIQPKVSDTKIYLTHEKPDITFDPIFEVIKKMKNNPIEVPMTLNLNIPSQETFNALSMSFENFDEKLVDFIFLKSNIKQLKKAFRDGLREFYSLPKVVEIEEVKIEPELQEPLKIEQEGVSNDIPFQDSEIN